MKRNSLCKNMGQSSEKNRLLEEACFTDIHIQSMDKHLYLPVTYRLFLPDSLTMFFKNKKINKYNYMSVVTAIWFECDYLTVKELIFIMAPVCNYIEKPVVTFVLKPSAVRSSTQPQSTREEHELRAVLRGTYKNWLLKVTALKIRNWCGGALGDGRA